MDKNTFTGLLLIGAILLGFTLFNRPAVDDKATHNNTPVEKIDSTENKQIAMESYNLTVKDSVDIDSITTPDYMVERPEEFVELKNNLLSVKITNKGGMPVFAELCKYVAHDGNSVRLFDGNKDLHVNFPLRTNQNTVINTADSYFQPISQNDSSVVMRMTLAPDVYLDYHYKLKKDDYRLIMDISGQNLEKILPSNMSVQDIEWSQKIRQQEQSWKFELQYTGIYYHFASGDVDHINISDNKEERISERVNWLAFKDKYFSTVLLNNNGSFDNNTIKTSKMEEGSGYVAKGSYKSTYNFSVRDGAKASFTWLFTPNDYDMLSSYSKTTIDGRDMKFQHLVYLGWSFFRTINKYLIIPVVVFLNKFISNWGIIILLLTLFIKLLLSPLTYKSQLSQAKMRVLKPQVDAIKDKYPGKDKDTMMKRQTETMSLYKSVGASPMSGCLPMLLQAPFFIALYMYFPTSILLRGESFLWIKDLSTYDAVITWSGNIPIISGLLGNHISLMCLLMTITNIVYQKYTMSQNTTGQEGMPSMKMMPYIMAIMFFFIFNSNASGLCYYYFISTLITVIQYFVFRYTINEEKLLAQMEENKKKPKKKSGFMQRLEEAQRMQREMQNKKNKKK